MSIRSTGGQRCERRDLLNVNGVGQLWRFDVDVVAVVVVTSIVTLDDANGNDGTFLRDALAGEKGDRHARLNAG